MKIGDAIKQIRKELNYTQIDLAVKLHITVTTVSRWESGRSKPGRLAMSVLADICREKGVSQSLIDEITDDK